MFVTSSDLFFKTVVKYGLLFKKKEKKGKNTPDFPPFFSRVTVVLCKELSFLSREFTTSLTTVGVRIVLLVERVLFWL